MRLSDISFFDAPQIQNLRAMPLEVFYLHLNILTPTLLNITTPTQVQRGTMITLMTLFREHKLHETTTADTPAERAAAQTLATSLASCITQQTTIYDWRELFPVPLNWKGQLVAAAPAAEQDDNDDDDAQSLSDNLVTETDSDYECLNGSDASSCDRLSPRSW
ncbi:MAG: hypothetical protein P1U34_06630 [Coxiellaceae bacterium]|nr:hypothetical protein [Coxiellaceae bacterium]